MNREILRLAIPNIISNISIPLLASVDIWLMGHQSSIELGAVGVAGMIFNFLYWNFGFLRMGTTGMTAQAFGRNDALEINSILQKAVVFAIIISLLLLLLMIPIAESASYLMNVDPSQKNFINEYFFVRIWAAPASLCLYALLGWFFGMQNAKIPLIITVSINVVNILLSYWLVEYAEMGIRGVALGTLIAQYFGFAIAIYFVLKKYKSFISPIPFLVLIKWDSIKRFLNINRDIFLRTICLSFAFAFLYSQASKEGAIFLAANVVLLQFLNWMSYGIDGFAFAAESLVGKYVGAKDNVHTIKVIKSLFIWGAGLALFYTLFFWLFGLNIIKLFTDQKEVIAFSGDLLIWVIILPLISFACYIWDGIFIGITASVSMRNSMVLSLIIYLLCFYGLKELTGEAYIWLSLFVFLAARGIIQSILFAYRGLSLN